MSRACIEICCSQDSFYTHDILISKWIICTSTIGMMFRASMNLDVIILESIIP